MGWGSGAEVFERVWSEVRRNLPQHKLDDICVKVIGIFEDFDCDTIADCIDRSKPEIAFAVYKLNSDYFDDMVEAWHSDGADEEIHEYLGITRYQYAKLVERQ